MDFRPNIYQSSSPADLNFRLQLSLDFQMQFLSIFVVVKFEWA